MIAQANITQQISQSERAYYHDYFINTYKHTSPPPQDDHDKCVCQVSKGYYNVLLSVPFDIINWPAG